MPTDHLVASGHLKNMGPDASNDLTWEHVVPKEGAEVYTKANSPYAKRFRLGAKLTPRMFVLVEEDPPGPLQPKTAVAVHSRRGRLDKKPWSELPDLTGVVEKIFVYPVYLGEHCLPFSLLSPAQAVIPFDGKELLSGDNDRIDRYPGLASWWRKAEQVWMAHRSSERFSLLERINYINQLSAQLPVQEGLRVVYSGSGNYLAAAIVNHPRAIIDQKLYWAPVGSQEEGRYLTAILNSPALGEIIRPYQSVGAFGPRDFDKYVWYPPIPEYDGGKRDHSQLADLAQDAEQVAAGVELPRGIGFQRARALIRNALNAEGLLDQIDELVKSILTPS